MYFEGKRVLVTGGTGSLGQAIVRRLLGGADGLPRSVIVFSRDEAKQHEMRLAYRDEGESRQGLIRYGSHDVLRFRIGDIRDIGSVARALREADVVIHAAGMKQVPTCEYSPSEAIKTNIEGALNLVAATQQSTSHVEAVVGVSTDKACKPVNMMGVSKAAMEKIFVQANLESADTRFVCVRYGNVIASRGSVVPVFEKQIAEGGPVTITDVEMTRFLLPIDRAVDTCFDALAGASPGETYVPMVPAARIIDVARVLIGDRDIRVESIGVREGEKVHEILISEEELPRTSARDGYYVMQPVLKELQASSIQMALTEEYSSARVTLDEEALRDLLAPNSTLSGEAAA